MKKLSMFHLSLLVAFGGLAIAGMLVFALAVGGGDASKALGHVVIWGTIDKGVFDSVLQQAVDKDTQLSQVKYEQKDPTTYESALTNALANGEGPDLFLMRQDYVYKNMGKTLVVPFTTVSKSQFESTFIQAASQFVSESGIVGVPLFADPLVLYWNKDILASAGFAQPPKYWDELFNMSQKITLKDDAGSIRRSAIAMGEYKNVNNAKDIVATLILQAGGFIMARDVDGGLMSVLASREGDTSQGAISALRFYTEFADPSKNGYSWNRSLPLAQQAFGSGDLAMYVGYASENPLIEKSNSNLNYAIAPLPQIRSRPTELNAARVYALAVSRAGKNPTGATTAAFLLASAETGKLFSSALGISSARRDVVNQPAEGNAHLFNQEVIIAHSWLDPDPEKTAEIFRVMIENTTSGTLLVTEAIYRGHEELGRLLDI